MLLPPLLLDVVVDGMDPAALLVMLMALPGRINGIGLAPPLLFSSAGDTGVMAAELGC